GGDVLGAEGDDVPGASGLHGGHLGVADHAAEHDGGERFVVDVVDPLGDLGVPAVEPGVAGVVAQHGFGDEPGVEVLQQGAHQAAAGAEVAVGQADAEPGAAGDGGDLDVAGFDELGGGGLEDAPAGCGGAFGQMLHDSEVS